MKPHLIILGAGRSRGDGLPLGLQRVTLERRVLDWQLDAFSQLSPEVSFVGGYDIAQVMQHFPGLAYHFNRDWESTGSLASLALALDALEDLEEGRRDLYIAYSDILLRPALVQALAAEASDVCSIAVDSKPPAKAGKQPESITLDDGSHEFVGLIRVPASQTQAFRSATIDIAAVAKQAHLSALVEKLQLAHPQIRLNGIAAGGLWAHAEHGKSVAQFVLGSKAATLARLQNRVTHSKILSLEYFTRTDYTNRRGEILAGLAERFAQERFLIVRSSATDEDGFANANAGRYHSELNVTTSSLGSAIDLVFASYSGEDPLDEVLVQPQLDEVRASGVIFTRVLETGAPYRVFNYTEGSDTTAITAGYSRDSITQYVYRQAGAETLARLPSLTRQLLTVADEIEEYACHDALDIEFAVDASGQVFTLQVRPLMIDDAYQDRSHDGEIQDCLQSMHIALHALSSPPPGHAGRETAWSVMADWNPAEILGRTPGPLALDLYRHIITDRIWAVQRHEVGYRDLRAWPLIRSFAGQAFVDVRSSVNSFIPASVSEELAQRMTEYAINKLKADKSLHDKLEFELIPTCLDFNFAEWRQRYQAANVCSDSEVVQLESSLRKVTRNIVSRAVADLTAAKALEARCTKLVQPFTPLSDWLRHTLHICAEEGTLTFAHLARAGFVAAALLRSATRIGILQESRCAALMESIPGIGKMLTDSASSVRSGELSKQALIEKFGHLRPGTYDISTPAYRDRPEEYLDPIIASAHSAPALPFAWTIEESTALNSALKDLDIGLNADTLLDFVRTATVGREYAKFVFTRLLSAVLDTLSVEGQALGIAPDRLESMPLHVWLEESVLTWGKSDSRAFLMELTERRHQQHRLAGMMLLPPVITELSEIESFAIPASNPTFITVRQVRAPLRLIFPGEVVKRSHVENCVVAIANADPGFDYLFALGISGLITAFGGPNSHMAIRASEFSIPAVIGIGEQALGCLRDGTFIDLDCQKKRWQQEGITCA
jgi:phosphohistidine swiveling domain-containing protein